MTEHVVRTAAIHAVLDARWAALGRTALGMGLVSCDDAAIVWRAERVRQQLPAFGQELLAALTAAVTGAGWPEPGRTPPVTGSAEPAHRMWLSVDLLPGMPWEAAADASGAPAFCDDRFSLAYQRRVQPDGSAPAVTIDPPRVLVVSSMPQGMPSANTELQRAALDRLASPSVVWYSSHDLAAIRDRIALGGFSALHVVAHGLPGRVLWYDEHSQPVWFDADQFLGALSGVGLRFVLWLVCHSGSPAAGTGSLLSATLAAGIDGCVAMRSVVDDVTAARFVGGFYAALSTPTTVALDTAVNRGRAAVRQAAGEVAAPAQWAAPVVAFREGPLLILQRRPAVPPPAAANDRPVPARTSWWLVADDRRHPLTATRTRIGRSVAADLLLPGPGVAPFHATVVLDRGRPRLVDERTGHPTLVNDSPVGHAMLRAGDVISIGPHRLVVDVEVAQA